MRFRKPLLILLALIAAYSFAACRKASAPAEQSTTSGRPAGESQHPQGGIAPTETWYFKGSIGSALGLQMKLVREADKLTGTYFYQKVGTKIEVRGTIDSGNNVVLEEFDANGKQTGVFKGLWKTGDNGLIEIAGNWTKPDGSKAAAFSIQQEPIEFTNGVEIIARQIQEKNKKLKYEIDVEYPQLTGSTDANVEKFNQAARSLVTKQVNAFRAQMTDSAGEENPVESESGSDLGAGYTIELAQDDLISVQFDIGGYSAGAAHPNSYTDVINFDLSNGKQLKLADLFKPGAKYLQTLSAYCIQDLKKQSRDKGEDGMLDDDWIQRGAGAETNNFRSWTITRNGLGINFDSYQVGPYAAGPQFVLVPYSALKEIIKPDGPIAKFAK
ncbi:MAG TPA: DUF3298 and DUF4163 domain-containing protein [Pyrinomonadaceae bacterium]|nr:DUF3298 and DUF4163 domain-containing protein [Pyrinomonadaceae bacterium]